MSDNEEIKSTIRNHLQKHNYQNYEGLLKMIVPETRIDCTKLTTKNMIKEGGFGFVFRYTHLGTKLAVKKMKKNSYDLETFLNEIFILYRLKQHPNIIRMIGYCFQPYPGILFEWCTGRDLYDFIYREDGLRKVTSNQIVEIAQQIACGMREMHSLDIVHRDLKPTNVMIQYCESDLVQTQQLVVKIIDFGLSTILLGDKLLRKNKNSSSYGVNSATQRFCKPPEILYRSYCKESDVWCFGMILYQLVAGAMPWNGVVLDYEQYETCVRDLVNSLELCKRKNIPDSFMELIQMTTRVKFQARPSFDDIYVTMKNATAVRKSLIHDLKLKKSSLNAKNELHLMNISQPAPIYSQLTVTTTGSKCLSPLNKTTYRSVIKNGLDKSRDTLDFSSFNNSFEMVVDKQLFEKNRRLILSPTTSKPPLPRSSYIKYAHRNSSRKKLRFSEELESGPSSSTTFDVHQPIKSIIKKFKKIEFMEHTLPVPCPSGPPTANCTEIPTDLNKHHRRCFTNYSECQKAGRTQKVSTNLVGYSTDELVSSDVDSQPKEPHLTKMPSKRSHYLTPLYLKNFPATNYSVDRLNKNRTVTIDSVNTPNDNLPVIVPDSSEFQLYQTIPKNPVPKESSYETIPENFPDQIKDVPNTEYEDTTEIYYPKVKSRFNLQVASLFRKMCSCCAKYAGPNSHKSICPKCHQFLKKSH